MFVFAYRCHFINNLKGYNLLDIIFFCNMWKTVKLCSIYLIYLSLLNNKKPVK